jgi:hypothetical protein
MWKTSTCFCNTPGTSSNADTCDDNTGACSCTTGYTGAKCDTCDGAYYGTGALPSKTCTAPVQLCIQRCLDLGFCCQTSTTGSNRYFSCAQGCAMRHDLDLDFASCEGWCSLQENNRQCSRTVEGRTFSFCTNCYNGSGAFCGPTVGDCTVGCRDGIQCDA